MNHYYNYFQDKYEAIKDNLSQESKQDCEKALVINNFYNNISQGNYTDSESIIQKLLSSVKTERERVIFKFNLGKIYMHFSEVEKAKNEFGYVIEHGNKLAIVQLAVKQINSIANE
jgi:hypothetical protein